MASSYSSSAAPRACVVGAGPVGLSSAEALARSGFSVTVLHRDPIGRRSSTSAGPAAAGLIEPVAVDPRDTDLVVDMFRESYLRWLPTAADLGVDRRIVRYRAASESDRPQWLDAVDELPQPAPATWAFATVVVTPAIWFPATCERLKQRGVVFRQWEVGDRDALLDLGKRFDVVVNASGPGAWHLGDERMFGKRGILMWAQGHPDLQDVLFDAETFTYAIPQRDVVALGGTQDEHRGDPDRWSREPSAADVEALLRRLRATPDLPDLDDLKIIAVTCDYRPARDRIRIETEYHEGAAIVHVTGFGGSGWTLAPAAARRAADLSRLVVGMDEVQTSTGTEQW